MSRRTEALVLWCAATDRTFVLAEAQGERVLLGKCIHCNKALCVDLQGRSLGRRATLEHLLPRTHGGEDSLTNLALACSGCNSGKGIRLDHRPLTDPTLAAMIERLQARRAERLREPPEGLRLPPSPFASKEPAEAGAEEPAEPSGVGRRSGRRRGRAR